jgi:hypothetical protein
VTGSRKIIIIIIKTRRYSPEEYTKHWTVGDWVKKNNNNNNKNSQVLARGVYEAFDSG